MAARHGLLSRPVNAKVDPHGQYAALKRALRNSTPFACNLLRLYAQDYACLGYAFPPAALRDAACLASLLPAARRAIRKDCARRAWPLHCATVRAMPE